MTNLLAYAVGAAGLVRFFARDLAVEHECMQDFPVSDPDYVRILNGEIECSAASQARASTSRSSKS